MNARTSSALLASSLLLASCGSSREAVDGGTGGGGGSTEGSGGGDRTLEIRAGKQAYFWAAATGGAFMSTEAVAMFSVDAPSRRVVTRGACAVFTSDAPSTGAGDRDVDAGEVTLIAGARLIGLEEQHVGRYAFDEYAAADWSPGQDLVFHASGAPGAAPIVGVVRAPDPLIVTGPIETGSFAVKRADGLALTWRPLGNGDVSVSLSGKSVKGATVVIECGFDGSAGSGAVSAELLQSIEPGPVTFAPFSVNVSVDASGGFDVLSVAGEYAQQPSGERYVPMISLE